MTSSLEIAKRSNIVNSFNSLIDEFAKKMIATFPQEHKLSIWYLQFKTSKTFNSKFPMEYIMDSMIDFGYQILTKDERFFKKDEYVQLAEGFSEKTGLINIWDTTTPQVKEAIWQYIQKLYVLGMNGIGKQDELKQVLIRMN